MKSIILGVFLVFQSCVFAAVAQTDDIYLTDEQVRAAAKVLAEGWANLPEGEDASRACEFFYQNRQWSVAAGKCSVGAQRGDSVSQYYLGILYEFGAGGLPKSAQTAASYYQLSLSQGYSKAQNQLGNLYEQGANGFPRDYAKAWFHYQAAASQNLGIAYAGLGDMTANGLGRPKNKLEAVKYYLEAKRLKHQTVDGRITALQLGMLREIDNMRQASTYYEGFQPPNLNDTTWNINRKLEYERQLILSRENEKHDALDRDRQQLFDKARQFGINVTKAGTQVSVRGDKDVVDLFTKIYERYNSQWTDATNEAEGKLAEIDRWVARQNGR